jgi:hypothetical protein
MSYKYADRTIFILGSPRSGTAWLAKLLDSHPDVLYRHEPDIVLRNYDLPTVCELEDARRFIPETQEWLNALADTRTVMTIGPLPNFSKNYFGPVAREARAALVGLLKMATRIPVAASWAESVTIPDFVDIGSDACRRLIISSVSAMGRAGLILSAAPESRFILMLRHPWGQIESIMRLPEWNGELEIDWIVAPLASSAPARRRNLSAEKLLALPPIEQLAWVWVLHNEMALEQLAGAPYFRALRLYDLNHNPTSLGRSIFEFCGVPWCEQTTKFVAWSTRGTGNEGYYSMKRDPDEATWGWRRRLTQPQIDAITEIVADSVPGEMFMADMEPNALAAAPPQP